MKSAVLILALACSSCATCSEHPTACAAVTIVAAGSLALMAGSHDNSGTKGNSVTTIPVDCTKVDCR